MVVRGSHVWRSRLWENGFSLSNVPISHSFPWEGDSLCKSDSGSCNPVLRELNPLGFLAPCFFVTAFFVLILTGILEIMFEFEAPGSGNTDKPGNHKIPSLASEPWWFWVRVKFIYWITCVVFQLNKFDTLIEWEFLFNEFQLLLFLNLILQVKFINELHMLSFH